jgi:hypothetical protein
MTTPAKPWSKQVPAHLLTLQNKARKSAALARTLVDYRTFSADDVHEVLERADLREAILRATLDERGEQRFHSASMERWTEVVAIAQAFLRDV